ncbi:hypothetical protein FB45DRAFT_876123 [Roridomyces roridus]|uniref:DUF6534 domain-containing protein n=1 Tax=Roridomyces roridus TaxID=1738132 RepID=A0AAD7FBF0_9AGAR|nr:hypothetical protein FB45DRAFT_876123 [Roridomyces roridus]
MAAQLFFAYRIYVLGDKQRIIPTILGFLSMGRFMASLALFIIGIEHRSLVLFEDQFSWLTTSLWVLSAVNDIGITASMVHLLLTHRNGIHRRTVPLIDKLIGWTIETGIMTSIWALLTLIVFRTMGHNCMIPALLEWDSTDELSVVWIATYTVGVRVYSNTLLAR